MADLSPEARRIYDLLMAPTSEEYETRFLAYKKETLDAVRKSARTSAATETAPSPSSSTARLLVPRDTSLAASRAVLSTTGDLSPEAHRIDMHATDLAPPAPTTCLAECPSRDASVSLSVLTPLAAPTATSDSVLELPEYTTKCSFFSPHRSDDLPSSPPLATTMSRPPRPLATTSPAAGITLNYVRAFLTTEVVHAAAPMVFDPGAVTPASAYTSSEVVVSVQNNGNNNGFSSQKPITCSMLVRDLDADNIRVTAVAHLNKGILMAISTPAEDTTCNMLFRCFSLKCRPLPWPSFEFNQVWIQFWYVYVSEKISGFTSKVMGITSGDDTKFGDGKGWSELCAIDLYHTVKPNVCCMPIDTLSEQDLESDCKTIIRCCPKIPDDALVDIVPFPMLESVVKLVMSLRKMGGAVHTQFLGPLPQAQVYWSHFKMEIVIVSFLPTLGSYCVSRDHYPWVPELLQFHPLLYSWFQFWSTRKASLYGYNASQFQWEFAWPTTTQTHSTPYGMHMYLNPECSTVIYSMKIEVESLSISPVSVMHLHWDPGGFTRYGLRVKEDFTVAEFTSRYFVDVLLCSGLEGQPSTCVVMLQTYRFYPTRISSWKDAMLAVNQWVLMRCIPFVWHSFEMELVLDSYDRMCLTSHFLQRASFLMQWKIPWLFSWLVVGSSCTESDFDSSENLTNNWMMFGSGEEWDSMLFFPFSLSCITIQLTRDVLHLQQAENACHSRPPDPNTDYLEVHNLLCRLTSKHFPAELFVIEHWLIPWEPGDDSPDYNLMGNFTSLSIACDMLYSVSGDDNLLTARYLLWCIRCVQIVTAGPSNCMPYLRPKPPWSRFAPTTSTSDSIRTVSKTLQNINISYELKLGVVAAFCARLRPPETYFLLVDFQHDNNKDMSSGNYPLPSVDHVQFSSQVVFHKGALLGGYIPVGCPRSARKDELTQGYAAVGVDAPFRANKILLLPWDPGDYSASVWRQSNKGRVDDVCDCPGVDMSQVPWDPGDSSRVRLGVKPNFKEGGLSATLYTSVGLDKWAITLGPILHRDVLQIHRDMLTGKGIGTDGLDGGFGRGLAGRACVACVPCSSSSS